MTKLPLSAFLLVSACSAQPKSPAGSPATPAPSVTAPASKPHEAGSSSPSANPVPPTPPEPRARTRPRLECVDRFFAAAGQRANSGGPELSGDGRLLIAIVGSQPGGPFGDTIATAVTFDRVRGQATLVARNLAKKPAELPPVADGPRIANDGSYVVWPSAAANVVEHDTNNRIDVFLSPFSGEPIERVSVSSSGAEANGDSGKAFVSSGGRSVYFASMASNLVPDDSNGKLDLFVRDRAAKTTTRLAVSNDGRDVEWIRFTLAIAADAGVAVFVSQDPALLALPPPKKGALPLAPQVFVRDLLKGQTDCLSCLADPKLGPLPSGAPAVSRNGRYVVFHSMNPDLDPASKAGKSCPRYVYVFDREQRTTQRVLCTGDIVDALAISDDSQTVAVAATKAPPAGSNDPFAPVPTYVRVLDRRTQRIVDPTIGLGGQPGDGRFQGVQLSPDGQVLAFESTSTDLVPSQPKSRPDDETRRVFIYDGLRLSGELERVPFDSEQP